MKKIYTVMIFIVAGLVLNITGCSGLAGDGTACDATAENCETPPEPEIDKDACIESEGIWGENKCTTRPEESFSGSLDISAPKQFPYASYYNYHNDTTGPECDATLIKGSGDDTGKNSISIDVDYPDFKSLHTVIQMPLENKEFDVNSLDWLIIKSSFSYKDKNINGKLVIEDFFLPEEPSDDECIFGRFFGYIKVSIDISGTFELSPNPVYVATDKGDATADADIDCLALIYYANCVE